MNDKHSAMQSALEVAISFTVDVDHVFYGTVEANKKL